MKQDPAANRIRKYLEEHFPVTRKIDDKMALLQSGILDSLGILELVSFLEREFEITIEDEDLLPRNFETMSSLVAFVKQKSHYCG